MESGSGVMLIRRIKFLVESDTIPFTNSDMVRNSTVTVKVRQEGSVTKARWTCSFDRAVIRSWGNMHALRRVARDLEKQCGGPFVPLKIQRYQNSYCSALHISMCVRAVFNYFHSEDQDGLLPQGSTRTRYGLETVRYVVGDTIPDPEVLSRVIAGQGVETGEFYNGRPILELSFIRGNWTVAADEFRDRSRTLN